MYDDKTLILSRGWHSNIFCTPIFILSQDESQGSITEIADGQKSNLLLEGSTLHFSKAAIRIINFVVHRIQIL